MRFALCLFALLVSSLSVRAQLSPGDEFVAFELHDRPIIDGILDEGLLGNDCLKVHEHFVLLGLDAPDTKPHIEGMVWIGYADNGLYLAARVFKKREAIHSSGLRRDGFSPSFGEDGIWVFLDRNKDGRNACFFGVNSLNTRADGTITNEGGMDFSWDADWHSGVFVDSLGLTYEIFIPWRSIGFKGGTSAMGLNIVVTSSAPPELASWSRCYRSILEVSLFNTLKLPRTIEPPFVLGFRPQVRFRHEKLEESGNSSVHGGIDMLIRSGRIVDGIITLSPDFAEAEPDADEIILDKESQRYLPEKRMFFQMGLGLINSPVFYSRRIEDIDFGVKCQGVVKSADYALFGWVGKSDEGRILNGVFGGTSWAVGRKLKTRTSFGVYQIDEQWAAACNADIDGKITKEVSFRCDLSVHNESAVSSDSALFVSLGASWSDGTSYAGLTYKDVGNSAQPSIGFFSEEGYRTFGIGFGRRGRIKGKTQSYWILDVGANHFIRQNGERYRSGGFLSLVVSPFEKLTFGFSPTLSSVLYAGKEYTNRSVGVFASYGKGVSFTLNPYIDIYRGVRRQCLGAAFSAAIGNWLDITFLGAHFRQEWEQNKLNQCLFQSWVTLRPREWLLLRSFGEYSEISQHWLASLLFEFAGGGWKIILAGKHYDSTMSLERDGVIRNVVLKIAYEMTMH